MRTIGLESWTTESKFARIKTPYGNMLDMPIHNEPGIRISASIIEINDRSYSVSAVQGVDVVLASRFTLFGFALLLIAIYGSVLFNENHFQRSDFLPFLGLMMMAAFAVHVARVWRRRYQLVLVMATGTVPVLTSRDFEYLSQLRNWVEQAVAERDTGAVARPAPVFVGEMPSREAFKSKPCPYCAETIKEAARVCRFCGSSLDASSAPIMVPRRVAARHIAAARLLEGDFMPISIECSLSTGENYMGRAIATGDALEAKSMVMLLKTPDNDTKCIDMAQIECVKILDRGAGRSLQ